MSKPCEIPRDLKPGDVIVDSKGALRQFEGYWDDDAVCSISVFTSDGRRFRHGMTRPYAVRIIRKTSKPAKVNKDRDAEWLRLMATPPADGMAPSFTDASRKRLRRIAKRLESMQ